MTQQSYIILALLAVLSILGNYFSLPLFFGVKFIFGSIAVLLVIHLFGVKWAVTIALLTNSHTFFLWEQPFNILIYSLEALFIGLTWQRYINSLLLLEGMFWLCLAVPITWLFYTYIIPLDTLQISLITLKFLVNSMVNASIVCLIIIFLPLKQWARLPVSNHCPSSLPQILVNFIAAFVLLPALIIVTVNGKLIVNQVEQQIKNDLNTLSQEVTANLRLLHHEHIQALQAITQIDIQNSAHLAQHVAQIRKSFPEFLNITVTDAKKNFLFSYPEKSDEFKIDLTAAQFQQVLKKPQGLTFQIQSSTLPIMAHLLPIQYHGQVTGVVMAYWKIPTSLDKEQTIQKALTHHAQITLTNKDGFIIHSTRNDLELLKPYARTSTPLKSWHTTDTYLSFPPLVTHAILCWRDAIYVQYVPASDNLPITVVVEIPLRDYLSPGQQLYINHLAIIALIALLSLIFAMIISRWLVTPLLRLARVTNDLPSRVEKKTTIQWPQSQVREIDSLTNNFKSMALSLQARFDEIHSAKELLEQRVQTHTRALLHERSLLRNLIDSIPDLICYKDRNGVYLGCNKAFEEFVGLSEHELIGKTYLDKLSQEKATFCKTFDQQVLVTGKPQTHETWVTYPDGHQVRLDSLKTPFFTPDEQILGLISISRDITVRQQVEDALRQSQQMLRLVIDNIPQFIFWKDQQGIYLGCNQNFAQIVNIKSAEAIVGKTDKDLTTQFQPAGATLFEILNRCISVDSVSKYQYVESLPLAKGSQLWLEMNNIPLRDAHNQVIGVLGSFEDITKRRQDEEKLRQWVKVLENSAEAIIITDAQTRILQVNKAFTKITGYSETEVLNQFPSLLQSGQHKTDFYDKMWQAINMVGYWEGEIWNRRKRGEIYPQWLHISVIKDEEDDKITNYLAIFSDLTVRKKTEQRLAYLAHYDDLTGLPNRTLFYERVSRAIYYAQEHSSLIAVIFLDLDGFKYVNDTWGHLVGDLLLKQVATRLVDLHCMTDTMARLGGDEFTIVLEKLNRAAEAERLAQKILKIMQSPYDLNGHETFITTSIGISLYPNDGKDVNSLLKHADAAMYRAKEKGKNNYQFFTAQVNKNTHKRLSLETKLRYALDRDEFVLYYQPQKDLKSERIVGAEVLIRWQHPEMGLVLPYTFIPLAEETGLIVPIGEWVLRHTCLQRQRWNDNNKHQFLRLSVNLSTRQFQTDLVKRVVQILDETHIDPTLLELELTESVLIQHYDLASKILNQFKDMGIRLAVDDFGTGYSSLSYIKRFPVNKLKIDQSFVRDIPTDKYDMSITKAIIALAHSLKMTVTAEGVETQSQQAFLKTLGCDEVQGYLIGHPLPEKEFIKLYNYSECTSKV